LGKLISFSSAPKRPRAAKVAWSKFEKRYGSAPPRMVYDIYQREWVAEYEEGEQRIPDREIAGS